MAWIEEDARVALLHPDLSLAGDRGDDEAEQGVQLAGDERGDRPDPEATPRGNR